MKKLSSIVAVVFGLVLVGQSVACTSDAPEEEKVAEDKSALAWDQCDSNCTSHCGQPGSPGPYNPADCHSCLATCRGGDSPANAAELAQ